MAKIKHYLPVVVWIVSVFIASVIPAKEIPSTTIWQFDKVIHFLFYGIMVALASYGYYRHQKPVQLSLETIAIIVLMSFLYGVAIECIQKWFVVDRLFDKFDILANGLGAVVAGFLLPRKYKFES